MHVLRLRITLQHHFNQSGGPMALVKYFAGLAFFAASSSAMAGAYIGVGAGQSLIEYNEPSGSIDFDPEDVDLKDSDTGMKVFGGYRFTLAAVEAAYIDFGRIDGNNGEYVEVSGFSGFGMLHLGLGPASLFGKVGGFMWESEASIDNLRDKKDGYDLAYGVGAMVGLLDVDVRLEYEYFNVGEFEDVSMVSVGVSYTF